MHRKVLYSVKDVIRERCSWLTIECDHDRRLFYTNVCGQLKQRMARCLTLRVRQERGCFIVDRRILVPLYELDTALAAMTLDKNVFAGEDKFAFSRKTKALHDALAEVNKKWGLTRGQSITETGAKHRNTEELLLVDGETVVKALRQVGLLISLDEVSRKLTLEITLEDALPDVKPGTGTGGGFNASVDDREDTDNIDIVL